MKKVCVIFGSVIGGAVIGSVATMFLAPKSGAEMRKDANQMMMEQLKHIHEHIKKCRCMMMGDCSTEENKMSM